MCGSSVVLNVLQQPPTTQSRIAHVVTFMILSRMAKNVFPHNADSNLKIQPIKTRIHVTPKPSKPPKILAGSNNNNNNNNLTRPRGGSYELPGHGPQPTRAPPKRRDTHTTRTDSGEQTEGKANDRRAPTAGEHGRGTIEVSRTTEHIPIHPAPHMQTNTHIEYSQTGYQAVAPDGMGGIVASEQARGGRAMRRGKCATEGLQVKASRWGRSPPTATWRAPLRGALTALRGTQACDRRGGWR